jgi:hypothetical protein
VRVRVAAEPTPTAGVVALQFESSALEHLVEPLVDTRGFSSNAATLAERSCDRDP